MQKALNRIAGKKVKEYKKNQNNDELISLNEFAKVNYSFEDSYIEEPKKTRNSPSIINL